MKPVTWLSMEVTEHMCPVIRDFFVNVYEHPESYLEPDHKETHSSLVKFQLALKKIPNWTNTQIKKQIDDITTRCTWFKQLLVGLFVAHVKMISDGIRTSSRSKRLNVKLPSDETFVHTCFVTCASDLYEDPYVMKEPEKKRDEELDKRLHKCIMKSIYKLIPTREILNEHIPVMNDMVCLGGGEEPETIEEPKTVEEPETIEEPDETMKQIPVPASSSSTQQKPDLFPDAIDDEAREKNDGDEIDDDEKFNPQLQVKKTDGEIS